MAMPARLHREGTIVHSRHVLLRLFHADLHFALLLFSGLLHIFLSFSWPGGFPVPQNAVKRFSGWNSSLQLPLHLQLESAPVEILTGFDTSV